MLEHGDAASAANAIRMARQKAQERDEVAAAHERYTAALPIYRRLNDLNGQAWCIAPLGALAMSRGQLDSAKALLAEAIPLFRRLETTSASWMRTTCSGRSPSWAPTTRRPRRVPAGSGTRQAPRSGKQDSTVRAGRRRDRDHDLRPHRSRGPASPLTSPVLPPHTRCGGRGGHPVRAGHTPAAPNRVGERVEELRGSTPALPPPGRRAR